MRITVAICLLLMISVPLAAQLTPFSEKGRWGLRSNKKVVVPATFDTIYGYDPGGKVCLACNTVRKTSNTGFMKITSVSYSCNYFNAAGQKLQVKNSSGDTTTIFSMGKNTVGQYKSNSAAITVNAGGNKHLVSKDFRQLTSKGYHHIELAEDPAFYLCQQKSASDNIYTGLINRKEELVIPFRYSHIKFNQTDSLIIACSAGFNASDEVYDYAGKMVTSSRRHIAQASKKYLLQKIFEPSEKFYLLNRLSGEEKELDADEVLLAEDEKIVLRKKKNWYSYNGATGEKTPIKKPTHE